MKKEYNFVNRGVELNDKYKTLVDLLKVLNGKYIAVGVPHNSEEKLFYWFGTLTSIQSDRLILSREDQGLIQIMFDHVIDVHPIDPSRRKELMR